MGFSGFNVEPNKSLPVFPGSLNWRGHVVKPGDKLGPGEYLQSPNGKYQLVFEQGGTKVVLYEYPGGRKWDSTKGRWEMIPRVKHYDFLASFWFSWTNVRNLGQASWLIGTRGASSQPEQAARAKDFMSLAAEQGVKIQFTEAEEYASGSFSLEDDGHLAAYSRSGVGLLRWDTKMVPTGFARGKGAWFIANSDAASNIPDLVFLKIDTFYLTEVYAAAGKSNYQTADLAIPT